MKKNWKELRKKRLLTTSASQHETFELCNRKWWLGSVRKLPVQSSSSQIFGTVLHAVAERFLNADELGRDKKTGQPVDLYPDGWEKAKDRFDPEAEEGEVTPAEADLIKKLIAKAIEGGVLERRPNGKVESTFNRQLTKLECDKCNGGGCKECDNTGFACNVTVTGFIDYMHSEGIMDHKTAGSMRYVNTPESLRKNLQILLYGFEFLKQQHDSRKPLPETVNLRHNVFCKNPDDLKVRKVDVDVPTEEVKQIWARLTINGQRMAEIRQRTERWSDIPDPPDMGKSCNAYGGCPFRPICSGWESEQGYEQRLDKLLNADYDDKIALENTLETSIQPKGKETTMLAARLAAMKNASKPVPVASAVNPPKIEAPAAPAPANGQPGTAPPWADASCIACKGLGFNSKGNPCRICDGKAAPDKASINFIVEPTGKGTIIWQHKEDDSISGETMLLSPGASAPVKVEEKTSVGKVAKPVPPVAKTHKAKEPEPESEAVELSEIAENGSEPAETAEAEEVEVEEAPTPTPLTEPVVQPQPGRPRMGITLLINCAPTKGSGKNSSAKNTVYLDELLTKVGLTMAARANVPSFYDINAFDRRDALMKAGGAIAGELGTKTVVALGIGTGQSDMKALADALLPYASLVISAVVG